MDAVTMEISIEAPQKLETQLLYEPVISHIGICSEDTNRDATVEHLIVHLHCCSLHNS